MLTTQDWRNGRRWLSTAVVALGMLLLVTLTGLAGAAETEIVAESASIPYPERVLNAGVDITCGLKIDRSVDCWGNNQEGQAEHQDGPFNPFSQSGGQLTRISTDRSGNQGNDDSWDPAISPDGRYVTFVSNAYNLWGGERYEHSLRVKDLQTGDYVSGVHGYQDDDLFIHPTISRDGGFVAFEYFNMDGYGPQGIDLLDVQQGGLSSIGYADEFNPDISDDGNLIVFESDTPGLVSGDDNNKRDIFIYDHREEEIDIVSVAVGDDGQMIYGNGSSFAPSISADGRYVVFVSYAENLIGGDPDINTYLIVKDLLTGEFDARGSGDEYEEFKNPVISGDGRFVASEFADKWGPYGIDFWDRQEGRLFWIGPSDSFKPSISADGQFVAFESDTPNLVSGDTNNKSDVFVYNQHNRRIAILSAAIEQDGQLIPSNGDSLNPAISADGRYVAFESNASNLVENDTNGKKDIFVYDRLIHENPLGDPEGIINAGEYHTCALSPNGRADCWGAEQAVNDHGQAGDRVGPFVQVGAGAIHSCGLKTDGSVDCWGTQEWYGQGEDQPGPFSQISVGGNHNCGLKPNGSVHCWGGTWAGQAENQTGPFVQISAGWDHTCGLGPDGTIDCWGSNDLGQAEDKTGPFAQVNVGLGHTCGLKLNGSAECWGWNEDGQAEDQTGPFIQISAGGRHTCGLKRDGSVDCWGFNSDGQAEDQTGSFVAISAGGTWMLGQDRWGHTCGLRPDGSVDCWGGNKDGQAEDQSGPFGSFNPSVLIPLILRS